MNWIEFWEDQVRQFLTSEHRYVLATGWNEGKNHYCNFLINDIGYYGVNEYGLPKHEVTIHLKCKANRTRVKVKIGWIPFFCWRKLTRAKIMLAIYGD
jgi:hypothetical protein